MPRIYCIIRPIWFDWDNVKLDTPFIMPIMYNLFEPKVLEFDDFSHALRYTTKMNEICQEEGRYRIVLKETGEKYAQQVVDTYREYRQREDARKLAEKKAGNCVILRLKRRNFTP